MTKTTKSNQEPNQTKTPDPLDELFNTPKGLDLELETKYVFEQYKLYVQMADKVSARRATTNSFFLTANSFLFVAMGALFNNSELVIFVPIILLVGIFFCIGWALLIVYYKRLNSCKYRVINEVEAKLPIKGFLTEWKLWKAQETTRKSSLTNIEIWIPASLIVLYSLAMILMIIAMSLNLI